MEKFDSGAVRSSDAADTDYWLITPIGLRRLAEVYKEYPSGLGDKATLINAFYKNINSYLSGDRSSSLLDFAAFNVSELILIEHGIKNINYQEGLGYFNIHPIIYKELAQTYNEGKIKYCSYNCELGFPIHDLLNHAERHVTEWRLGIIDDRHLPHALWNVLMAMHSEEKWPHLNSPYMREFDCELTEAVRKRIDEEMSAKKLLSKNGDVRDEEAPERGTSSRTSHARRSSKRSG